MSCQIIGLIYTNLPKLIGSTIRGRVFSHSVFCNLTRTKGGRTMIGVEFKTRLIAVSPTASVAAFLLLPRLCASFPSLSFFLFSCSLKAGNMSMPCLISSPLMRKTFNAPAVATAANGTRRVRIVLVAGDTLRRRGTSALRPRATEQEADTARK